MSETLANWLCGFGHWHTLPERVDNDAPLVVTIVVMEAAVGLTYLWIAAYWRKFAIAARDARAIEVMHRIKAIFVWCAISGIGFRLVDLICPAWPLWVISMVVLLYHTLRFVSSMQTGLVLVYKDVETLRAIREQVRFVETSQMELSALKEKLCEVRNMVTTSQQA